MTPTTVSTSLRPRRPCEERPMPAKHNMRSPTTRPSCRRTPPAHRSAPGATRSRRTRLRVSRRVLNLFTCPQRRSPDEALGQLFTSPSLHLHSTPTVTSADNLLRWTSPVRNDCLRRAGWVSQLICRQQLRRAGTAERPGVHHLVLTEPPELLTWLPEPGWLPT